VINNSHLDGAGSGFAWLNVDKLFAWFDQPMPKCFFGGFYKGLTGRPLTPLDLMCLIAAIPSQVGVSAARNAPTPLIDFDGNLQEKSTRFMVAHCIGSSVDAFYTAMTPQQTGDRVVTWVGYAVTAVNQAAAYAASVALDVGRRNDTLFWTSTIGTIVAILASGGSAALIRYEQGVPSPAPGKFGDLLTLSKIYLGAMHLARMAIGFGTGEHNDAVSNLIATAQNAIEFGIRMSPRPTSLPVALAYGVVQGGLTGARTAIEARRPI
jgi:hypothetical protein